MKVSNGGRVVGAAETAVASLGKVEDIALLEGDEEREVPPPARVLCCALRQCGCPAVGNGDTSAPCRPGPPRGAVQQPRQPPEGREVLWAQVWRAVEAGKRARQLEKAAGGGKPGRPEAPAQGSRAGLGKRKIFDEDDEDGGGDKDEKRAKTKS